MATYKQIGNEEEQKRKQQQAQQTAQQQTAAQQPAVQQQPSAQQAAPQAAEIPAASNNVLNAQQLLQQQMDSKPGAYESQWSEKLNGILDKIMNRQPFSYDVNADALYQMYKDQYVQQGKMAMQDTLGQAAALTGGYDNSYAQGVGQQAYQGYLQQLTAKIPELAQIAQDQYNQEGDDLQNLYGLIGNRENQDYSRYQDEVSRWNTDRDYLYNQYLSDRNYQYQQDRDKITDERYNQERQDTLGQRSQSLAQSQVNYLLSMGVRPNDDLLKAAGYDNQYVSDILSRAQAEQAAKAGGSGGGYGGGTYSSGDGSLTLEQMLQNMAAAGAPNSAMTEVIQAAVADGTISPEESNAWAQNFGLLGRGGTYKAPEKRRK